MTSPPAAPERQASAGFLAIALTSRRAVLANGLPPILALAVGFVDTAVFVHMGGLFVAHITGNVVLLGVTLAGARIGGAHSGIASLQLATFPIFVAAAILAAVITSRLGRTATTPLLWITTLVIAVSAGLALVDGSSDRLDVPVSLLMVAAMGVINAAQRLDPQLGPPFTVMTGNVTGLAIALAFVGRVAPHLPPLKGAGQLLFLVLAFAAGAALGALTVVRFGLSCLALPAALLAARLLIPRVSSEHP